MKVNLPKEVEREEILVFTFKLRERFRFEVTVVEEVL